MRRLSLLALFLILPLGAHAACTVYFTSGAVAEPTQNTFDVSGTPAGALASFIVNPTSDATDCGSWTAASDSSWLTVSTTSGNEGQSLSYTVSANTGAPRTGHVNVSWANSESGNTTAIYTVNQIGSKPPNVSIAGPYRIDYSYNAAGCGPQSPTPYSCVTTSGSGPYILSVNPGTYVIKTTNANVPNTSTSPTFTPYVWIGTTDGTTSSYSVLPQNTSVPSRASVTVTVPPGAVLAFFALLNNESFDTSSYDPNDFIDVTMDSFGASCTNQYGPTQVGVAYSVSCTASGGVPPWKDSELTYPVPGLAGTNTPDGTTVTNTMSGTPTNAAVGNYLFSMFESDSNSPSNNLGQLFSGTLPPPNSTVQIGCSPDIGPYANGVAYAAVCTASGGTAPYTWAIPTSALPSGLTYSASGATLSISGALNDYFASYSYPVTVTDANSQTATYTFTGNITNNEAMTIGCSTVSGNLEVGLQYQAVCAAADGDPPYTFSFGDSGSLPPGLSSSTEPDGTFLITGAPTSTGPYGYNIFASDSTGEDYNELYYQGTIAAQPTLSCNNSSGPQMIGTAYTNTCTGAGGVSNNTFSYWISSGALPAGVTLNPSSGVISGTPTTAGTYSYAVQIYDSVHGVAQSAVSYSGTVVAPLMVTCNKSAGPAEVGAAYTDSCSASGGVGPYTWSIGYSTSLPGGLSFTPNGATVTVSGSPTSTGPYNYYLAVSDSIYDYAGQNFSGTIVSAATFTCTNNSGPVKVGQSYTTTCTASNGVTPYSWTVGTLPAGLTTTPSAPISGSTLTISGTPTQPGSYSYNAALTDAAGGTSSHAFTGTIQGATPTLTCSNPAGPTQIGVAYTNTCTAAGGSGQWTITVSSGTPGLTVTPGTNSVTVSGTPTSSNVGTYVFTVNGIDSSQNAVQSTYSGVIPPLSSVPLVGCSPTYGPDEFSTAYYAVCTVSGGVAPYTWGTGSTTLPNGLTLTPSGSSATITGSLPPQTSDLQYSYSIQATDSTAGTAQVGAFVVGGALREQGIPVATGYSSSVLSLVFLSTATMEIGVPLIYVETAQNPYPPYQWGTDNGNSVQVALPPGLTLATTPSDTALITGIPTTTETNYNFWVSVSDSKGDSVDSPFVTNVAAQPTLSCSPTALTAGLNNTITCSASSGVTPYTYWISSGSLPAGMTLNSATGVISGTPAPGAYSFSVQVYDSATGSAAKAFAISGTATYALALACSTNAGPVEVGVPYYDSCSASGGAPPYTWSIDFSMSLPPGLTLNSFSGTTTSISGTPTSAGPYSYPVTLVDKNDELQQSYSGTIAAAVTFSCTNAAGPTQVGQAYTNTCTATNGVTPYTWAVGTLPAGVSYSANGATLTISGTPTQSGAYNYAAGLTDAVGGTHTQSWRGSIVGASPTLTSIAPTSAIAGSSAFALTLSGTNFDASSSVSFNGTTLTPSSQTSTQLVVTVPASAITLAGLDAVTVTTSGGTTPAATFTVAPGITLLNPNSATAGSPSFTMTVTGTGFSPGSGTWVSWKGATLPTVYQSSTTLTATVPASDVATAGTAQVTVTSNGATSGPLTFNIGSAPAISGLNPNTLPVGSPAFTLTVNGSNFVSGATVLWNGAALTTTYVSATQLTAAVPVADLMTAGTVPVTVNSGGVTTVAQNFTVVAPSISALNPNSATAGSAALTLTVTGANFVSGDNVLWNGTVLPTTFVSATQLTAAVPAADLTTAGSVPVTVAAGSIQSNAVSFNIGSAPAISALNPTNVPVGSPAFTLTVTGSNFASGATVLWNGAALTTTYVSATQLTASVPASDLTAAATVPVTVNSGGVTTAVQNFTVAAPTIVSLNPTGATAGSAALTLTVTGTNFVSGDAVLWNGAALTTTFVSATQLTAAVPATDLATAGSVPVTVGAGSVRSNAVSFNVGSAPAISALNPSTLPVGSPAFILTVTGSNFASGASVLWNGAPLATTYVSATQLTASVPATDLAAAITVPVTVSSGGVTTAVQNFVVSAPSIAALNPTGAIAGSGALTLTVTGTNFVSGDAVLWNGAPLTTTYISATQLTAAVPATDLATAGAIPVTVAAGSVQSNAVSFNVGSAPAISALNPSTAPVGSPAFTLTVTGSNFASGATVLWSGNSLTTTYISATQLTASVPASDLTAAATVPVTVNSGGVTTAVQNFTVAAPSIVSLNPTGATAGSAALTLTITGANFVSGDAVLWNGTPLTTTYVSATQLTAAVPAADLATAGAVPVTVGAGSVHSNAVSFNVGSAPAISALNPSTLPVGSPAFTLTVTGSNFASGATVLWSGVPLTTTYVSATQLTASVPATDLATTGTVPVSVNSGGVTTAVQNFAVVGPIIAALNPTGATAGSGALTLTVSGANFVSGDAILWNGTALTTTYVSATQLTAAVPASDLTTAGAIPVTVASGSVRSNAVSFNVGSAPAISALNPSTLPVGAPAFTLTVTGSNFASGATVLWNGTSLTTTYISATQLTASVPASDLTAAATVPVTVNSGGVTTAVQNFTVAAPSIISLNPTGATAGSAALTLTVTGANFVSGDSVLWNGTALTTTFVSATQLTATVPTSDLATAGSIPVTVGAGSVRSNAVSFNVGSAPAISALNPSSLPVGSPAFILTVTGSNFASGASVLWNGTALTTTYVSATQLTASVPATDLAAAATIPVTVTSGGVTTAVQNFSVLAPSISALNPTGATAGSPALTLAVTGTNFVSGDAVLWNGAALTTTFVSTTQLTASVPASDLATASAVPVTVAAGSVRSNAVSFNIGSAPAISALSPSAIPVGSPAFTLTVTGSNFVSGAAVLWNGTALTTTFVNATQLTALVPATDLTGAATIPVTVNSGGVVTAAQSFTVAAPSIVSLNPTGATAGSAALTLTVTGANFVSGDSVLWNGTTLTTTFVSASQLTAAVPASALMTAGSIPVTVAAGSVRSNAVAFNVGSAPAISALNPNTLPVGSPAFTLTVTGSNFASSATVLWNGGALPTTYVSATQLTAAVPATNLAAVATVPITVNSGGVITAAQNFTVAAPSIAALNPTGATAGSAALTLTVTGANFVSGDKVLWNGTALATTFVGTTQLTAAVPASALATAGSVSVTVAAGSVQSNAVSFNIGSAPAISALNPSSTAVGSPAFTLAVTGSNFASGATVLWNGAALTTSYVSATQLTASVPATDLTAAGTISVTVNSGGIITASQSFTVAPPSIGSLNPTNATAGSPALTLTVVGSNFVSGDTVLWNGTALTTTFVSATQLTAAVPTSDLAGAGAMTVTVAAGSVRSNAVYFNVGSGPAISALNPNTLPVGSPAFSLTVTGSNFASAAVVHWNGIPLTTTFVSSTQLSAAVPASLLTTAGTDQVTVVSSGSTSNSVPFTTGSAATITSLNPAQATVGGASFTLTVDGSNFAAGATVQWDTTALTTTFVSSTQLTATVPASLLQTAGSPQITVLLNGVASNAITFTVASTSTPAISSLSPARVNAGSAAFTLTVNGSSFASGAVVQWNGSALTTTFVSSSVLTASVPASLVSAAGTFPITVVSGGATSASVSFTVNSGGAIGGAPFILSLSPTQAAAGSGSFTLTINGSGFGFGTTVNWNSTTLTVLTATATQVTATVPASLIAAPGTAAIVVNSNDANSNQAAFPIVSTPVVAQLSPGSVNTGSGAFTLSVTGSGYTSGAVVNWNGTPLPTTFVSSTQLNAAVPASLLATPGAVPITVTSGGITSTAKNFTLSALATIVGLKTTSSPTESASVGVQIATPATVALNGTLQLSFTPSVSGLPSDYTDPNLQFSCTNATCSDGKTILDFTIPAGQTTVSPLPGGSITQGTVAGTITVTMTSLTRSDTGASVAPATPVSATLVVPALAPVITAGSVEITNMTSSGFDVELNGFSSTREVSAVTFTFTAAQGTKLNGTTTFTIPVTTPFASWFSSSSGLTAGSTFGLTVPFTLSGDTKVIQSVSVTLTNAVGVSAAETGSVTP